MDPSTSVSPASEAEREHENQSFFGSGNVFHSYCAEWGYRTGEKYLFDEFLNPGGVLLDIGCGTGRTSFLLADRFAEIDSFDVVSEMIRFARDRQGVLGTNARFFVGDGAVLPLPSDRYTNAIFSYNGIDGIPTPARRMAALAEVYRVLRPGGRFIFSTKSCFNWQYFKKDHLRRAVRRLGLPLFRDSESLGPGEVFVRQGDQMIRWHTSNPFAVKRRLKKIGFDIVYFNSEVRLGVGRIEPSVKAHFDRWDHFFVCEKRA